jgi:O-antigen/teichoic acid export membrane protein
VDPPRNEEGAGGGAAPSPEAADPNQHGLGPLLARNLRALGTSTVVGKVAGFASMVFLAKFLGTVQFGRYTAAIALVSIASAVTEAGTGRYVIREGAQRPEALGDVVGRMLVLRVALSAATIAVMIPVGFGLGFDGETIVAVAVFAAASGLRLVANTYLLALQALERLRDMATVQALQSLAQAAAMSVVAVLTRDFVPVSWAVFGVAAAYPFWARWTLARRWQGHIRWSTEGFWHTLRITTPFAVTSTMFVLLTYLDSVMIQAFKGDRDTGLYGIAYRILLALALFPTVYTESLTRSLSYLAAHDRPKMETVYSRAVTHLVIMALPLAAGGAILSRQLIVAMFGLSYADAAPALAILLVTLLMVFPGYVNVMTAYALGLEGWLARILPIVAGANAVANLGLIPAFGLKGAAAATLGAEVLFIAMATTRLAREGLRPGPFAPLAKACGAAAVMAAVVWPLRNVEVAVPVICGGIAYVGTLILTRAFDRSDRDLLRDLIKRPGAPPEPIETPIEL